ncbi:response regulator transcription factor [Mycolicibacterium boenickei]|nr:response regulator transcription factor [Mycolicibacterium boenickei]
MKLIELAEIGFAMAEIIGRDAKGLDSSNDVLGLLSNIVDADAAIITQANSAGGLTVRATQSYDDLSVRRMTDPNFLRNDPGYSSIMSNPEGIPLGWWDNAVFNYAMSLAAQEFLIPAGFAGGISMRFSDAAGNYIGDAHMSTRREYSPTDAQLRAINRVIRLVPMIPSYRVLGVVPDTGDFLGQITASGIVSHAPLTSVNDDYREMRARLSHAVTSNAGSPGFYWRSTAGQWYRVSIFGNRLHGYTAFAAKRRDPPFRLTNREMGILNLLCEGFTNREIARRLFLSDRTIAHAIARIMAKMNCNTRTAAVAAALNSGIRLL